MSGNDLHAGGVFMKAGGVSAKLHCQMEREQLVIGRSLHTSGRRLVWSSNRSGNFEIWIADADGSAPRQVTHDGFAAENPTITFDGRWIVYGSTHSKTAGIWKIHTDGTEATSLIQSPSSRNPSFLWTANSLLSIRGQSNIML